MKSWSRADGELFCGLCRRAIRIGEPYATLSADGHSWRKLRCAECAGEPVPDLPPLEPLETRTDIPTEAMTPLRSIAKASPFDYRNAAAGEREPGMEG
jgi:hypothetical protein